ncbi:GNAT family N-acetyltransferase [Aquimarina sp. LLG6339-5]|uniref:GNAT family N-acetyltransferase n=1 Tax=Aquimarina sp. LLG6339-5 TaxID=3160830 RepID=UPI0038657B53
MNTQEVNLRTLSLSDKSKLAQLVNNKNIWNNLRDYIPYPYEESDAETFINFTQTQDPPQSFGIECNNELCGVISLIVQNDVYKKSAEIGYWVGQSYWGNGIATKAVKLITQYGLKKLNLIRIYAGIFENNIASMRALEKNGYQKEGVFRKAIIKNGETLDEHRYFILSENQE